MKSGFNRIISWNKYLPKPELLEQNEYLNHLIEPSFQGANRLFVLVFEHDNDNDQTISNKKVLYSKCRNKRLQCHDWQKNVFDQPVKNNKVTYENIRNIATGQGDDCTTGYLLDYIYFKNYYKMIAVDISKQQALDADPKAI